MIGRNWFWAALASATLASAGVAACSSGDGDGGKGGEGGIVNPGGSGGGGAGGTVYDPAVDCAPICAKLVTSCFNRGSEADCVAACVAATTSKNVLQACGTCVAANECAELGTECLGIGTPCATGGLFDLSLKGSGFAAFEDMSINARLVEGEATVADENTGVVAVGSFGIRFTGKMREGRPYRVDYFVDADQNEACDPTDQVGTEEVGYAVENTTVNVTPGAVEPEGCDTWTGTGGAGGGGPNIGQATCQALSECCETPDERMDPYRDSCRGIAETDDATRCEAPLNMYISRGYCAPSIDCQKLKLCCDSNDFDELTVGCELAATSASQEICTALLASYVGAGYCQ